METLKKILYALLNTYSKDKAEQTFEDLMMMLAKH